MNSRLANQQQRLLRRTVVLALVFAAALFTLRKEGDTTARFSFASRGLGVVDVGCIHARPTNVLTLGGSVTWGSHIENRYDAYPFLLSANVTNLAVRATGPHYPAVCIESMLKRLGLENVEYDLIILEYSLNGIECMQPLLERLRRRFFKAVIMYVDIWSFTVAVKEKNSGKKPKWLVGIDKTVPANLTENMLVYGWPIFNVTAVTEGFVKSVDGLLYQLPVPSDPKVALDEQWFAHDLHHLSPIGHEIVAKGVLQAYCDEVSRKKHETAQAKTISDEKHDGTWGEGDQCVSWYEGPLTSPSAITVTGGNYGEFQTTKFAHEVNQGEQLAFRFKNPYDTVQKVGFVHMAKGSPTLYPKAQVTFQTNGEKPLQVPFDPSDEKASKYHVTNLQEIGVIPPQKETVISFQPIETKEEALRITAMILCPACASIDEGRLQCPMFNPTSRHRKGSKSAGGATGEGVTKTS